MAIRITQSDTFKTIVKFTTKTEDGKDEAGSYSATFKRLTTSQVKELRDSGVSDVDMLVQVLVDWKATNAETQEQIPFSEEIVRKVCEENPGFAAASILAFAQGVGVSLQKN